MRKCPKCDGEIADGRRICRKCGSIVQEVDSAGGAEAATVPKVISESNDRLAKGDESEPFAEPMSVAPEPSQGEISGDAIWSCPKCASPVTHEFAVCWNCGTTRDGVEDRSFPAPVTREDKGGAASGPAGTCPRVRARHFRSTFDSWEKLSQQAADFATEIGPERLISISHSEDGNDGVMIVWYWI